MSAAAQALRTDVGTEKAQRGGWAREEAGGLGDHWPWSMGNTWLPVEGAGMDLAPVLLA